jgi:hypothetical protein
MLDRLVTAITDLPVIVQGAMGSALFAVVLYVGQRAVGLFSSKLIASKRDRRKRYLADELMKIGVAAAADTGDRMFFLGMVLYRCARYVVAALLWLTLGLIFNSAIAVFGIIGYIGCIYYLLQSVRLLQPLAEHPDRKTQFTKLSEELKSLESGTTGTQTDGLNRSL